MRILFMGTPAFAVPSLERLLADGHEICGVFTQPDKPKNRGHKMLFSPVKSCALGYAVSVYQPMSLRGEDTLTLVQDLAPELIVVAAYGKILPETMLTIPKLGSINVHSSLLPKYRGAAPINQAILNGETETGVTIMCMAAALDAGDILLQRRTAIGSDEDAESLTERLSMLGAEALSETVAALASGTAVRRPQDDGAATYAPMLSREMSPVNWTRSAHEIHCQIRGLQPWPCATTDVIDGGTVKLYRAEEPGAGTSAHPGTIVASGTAGIDIACGDGRILRITELQAAGGKRMSADAYLRGHPLSGSCQG